MDANGYARLVPFVSGTNHSAQRKWKTIITPKKAKIAHVGTASAAMGKTSATSAAKN